MQFFKNKVTKDSLDKLNSAHAKLIEVHYLVAQRHTLDNTLRNQILALENRISNIKHPEKDSHPSKSKVDAAIKDCRQMVKKLYTFNEKQNAAQTKLRLSDADFAINDAKIDRANTGEFPNPIRAPRRI